MSAVLLDSNLIIYGTDPADPLVSAFVERNAFYASEISIVETLGFQKLIEAERRQLERFFRACAMIAVDRAVIDAAVRLRQRRKMGLGDALIAATALVHGLTLATRNAGDFRDVEGLRVVDPYQPV